MAITLDGTTGITTPGLSLAIENFSTTGNTTLGDASTDTLNVGNGDLVKDSSGRVGIGTASPNAKLAIGVAAAAVDGTKGVRITNSGGGIVMLENGSNNDSYVGTLSASDFCFRTNNTERARIDSSGNLGIGTSSPLARLDVVSADGTHRNRIRNSTANEAVLLFQNSNTGTANGDGLYLGIDGSMDAYLWNYENKPIAFGTNATERMRLDSSGNLGIGTSSPADMLDVKGNARVGQGQVVATSTVGAVGIYSGIASGSGNAQLQFFGKSVDNTGLTYELGRISGGSFGTYGIDGGLSFSTALNNGSNVLTLSERMRISSAGFQRNKVAVVASSSQETSFYLSGSGVGLYNESAYSGCGAHIEISTNATSGWSGLYLNRVWTASQDERQITFLVNGSTVGTITTNASSTSYGSASDYRLKHDIAPMTGALAKVALLKPVTYKWNVDNSDGQGFIAHELAEVCPTAVYGEKDAVNEDGSIKPQGVDTSFLVATLTAAIQEQQALITQLTARITALEGA